MNVMNLRNFVILAHIDHGKSTLADRFLEITGTVDKRQLKPQHLDRLESERERGITIKMAPARMIYHRKANSVQRDFILNLIDTPGHSDFSYEVSRALAAVEGAILLVDAVQGIQAQTLANLEAAKRAGLKIIGVVTKIDLNPPDLERTINSVANLLAVNSGEILAVSGKTGERVAELLEAIIEKIPPPRASADLNRALIFDSLYDEHKGVIAFIRVFDGDFRLADEINFLAAGIQTKIKEIGYFNPEFEAGQSISQGEIGYLVAGIKDPEKVKIGDTLLRQGYGGQARLRSLTKEGLALAGYEKPQPVVFVSFYPEKSGDYDNLKKSLAKFKLNDSSLFFEPDNNELLGRGFKCGFLGKLHFEITAERLEKEFKIKTIHSFPSVAYRIFERGRSSFIEVRSPRDFPEDYEEAQEPIVRLEIITPPQYLGSVMTLKNIFRLGEITTETLDDRLLVKAKLPLADLVSDFNDKLKSFSEGYASLSYQFAGYEKADLDKLEVLVAGNLVPGLTRILPKSEIQWEGRRTTEKLKELLPRQQFAQAVQARAGGRIIARETIPALRKDVTGYLYGGDRTRKMKLWQKQKKGKAKLIEMAASRQVQIPPAVFRELLKKN